MTEYVYRVVDQNGMPSCGQVSLDTARRTAQRRNEYAERIGSAARYFVQRAPLVWEEAE